MISGAVPAQNDCPESPNSRLITFLIWTTVIIFHFGTSAIATWPLLKRPFAWGNGPDLLLYSWIFGWDWHILTTSPLKLFDANIFYPLSNSLTSSDHRLGLLILWAIPWLLTKKQLFADAIALYLVYALTGVTLHIWIRHWTKDHISAGLAAALVNLNPFRILGYGGVHLVGIFWLPLALLGMDRFQTDGGKKWWLLMVAAFWLQFQVSFYQAYGALIVMAGYFILGQWLRPVKNRRREWIGVMTGCAVMFITLMPFVIPYLKRTSRITGGIDRLITTSPRFPIDFFICYPGNWLWGSVLRLGEFKDNFPLWMGISIPLLGIFWAVRALRSKYGPESFRTALLLGSLSCFMAILSLGPYLKLGSTVTGIPLPFLLFAKIAPGFDKMNMSYRMLQTALITWAPLVGFGLFRLISRYGGSSRLRRACVVSAIAFLLAVDIWSVPWPEPVIAFKAESRPVTEWLAGRKIEGGILEMPFTREEYLNNTLYMVQSLHHFHPMVNGYGSFFPGSFHQAGDLADKLPDLRSLQGLADMGVRTYVLHLDMIDFMRSVDGETSLTSDRVIREFPDIKGFLGVDEKTVEAFAASPYMVEVARFPKDVVYEYSETTELEGGISQIVPSPPDTILIYIHLRGKRGLIWRNTEPPIFAEITIFLKPIGQSTSGTIQSKIALSLPDSIMPGNPYTKTLPVNHLPGPGKYSVEIVATDRRISFAPVTIDLIPPVP